MKLLHYLSVSFQISGVVSAMTKIGVTGKSDFGCVWRVSSS